MRERRTDITSLGSERMILLDHLNELISINTNVAKIENSECVKNPISQDILGRFRDPGSRKAAITEMALLEQYHEKQRIIPSFLEAGPRAELCFDPDTVRAAIVTAGGVAPGLHCVIHSIVKRHYKTYSMEKADGKIFGIYNSFKGSCNLADNLLELDLKMTEDWLDQGGCKLGIVRHFLKDKNEVELPVSSMAREITKNLNTNEIDILYVIGGDGFSQGGP